MYRSVEPDKRQNYRSMFVSTVLAVFLTRVTRAAYLYVLRAAAVYRLCGSAGLCLRNGGNCESEASLLWNAKIITRIPMSLKAGLDSTLFFVIVFFAVGYFVAYVIIGKFRFATPGRLGNYTDENGEEDAGQSSFADATQKEASKCWGLEAEKSQGRNGSLGSSGGRENIVLVDACMTRLQVTVKDLSRVGGFHMDEGALK